MYYSTCTIKTDRENFQKMLELFKVKQDENGKHTIDFHDIIPIPDDLKNTTQVSFLTYQYGTWIQERLYPVLKRCYDTEIAQQDFLAKAILAVADNVSLRKGIDKTHFDDKSIVNLFRNIFNQERYGCGCNESARAMLWGTTEKTGLIEVNEDRCTLVIKTITNLPTKIFEKVGKDLDCVMSMDSLNIVGCYPSMLSYKDGVAADILPTIQHSVQYTDGIQRSVQSAVIECCILRETDEEILHKFNGYYSQPLEVREALHETLEKIVPKIRQYL